MEKQDETRGMTVVEFCEEVAEVKLAGWQKEYITKLYDMYVNNPDSFNHPYYVQRKAPHLSLSLLKALVILFDEYNKGEMK